MNPIRIATRASALAVAQSELVAGQLSELTGAPTELVEVSTDGDRDQQSALRDLGGSGVFVTAVRDAVLNGAADIAVHSLKDLPTAPYPGLQLCAVTQRLDPRDALVARDGLLLAELPSGARVGTGSPRREAQLNALGLGVQVIGIRGNIDTRLAKVDAGELDAVVLALAGLRRIGRADQVTEILDPQQVLPAPGQGALAVECRADAAATIRLLGALDDPDSRAAVTAERSLLATLEAGCSAPVGALADVVSADTGEQLWLRAFAGDHSGSPTIRLSATGSLDEPAAIGERLAAEMLAEGADALVASARITTP